MYKLVLADDEADIRQGLKEVVPFEELGFTVVGEAANGMEALALCEQLEPDLLITDIRMPLLDGLTLCRRVREVLPAAQFIILSGYDDFEYARQAIEVKTMGYLLKPISSAEFTTVLRDAKAALDEEFRKRRDVSRLKEYFHESMPLLREMLLSSLLSGDLSAEQVCLRAQKYGDDLQSRGYAVALVRLGDEDASGITDPELRLFAVRNILSEALMERAQGYRLHVFMHNGMLAILLLLKNTDEATLATAVRHLDEARRTVWHYLGCPLHIGVSAPLTALARVPAAARQAHGALDQSVLGGEAQVLCITDIQPDSGAQLTADSLTLRKLSNSIKAGDEGQAAQALATLIDVCKSARMSPRDWQAYLLEIFMCYMRIISELGLTRDRLDEHIDRLTRLMLIKACPSVDEAYSELSAFLGALLDAVEAHKKTSSRTLAAQAEDYIRQHYARADITLEKLCLHLHISPSYFSMVFKKETKKTFHQYVTELRMDRALTLLSSTEKKTAEIAEEVGLPDPSYFSYCFKKHFGYPPSHARHK